MIFHSTRDGAGDFLESPSSSAITRSAPTTGTRFAKNSPQRSAASAAEYLAGCVRHGARARLPDVSGPEVLTVGEMAKAWIESKAMNKRIASIPIPRAVAGAVLAGHLTVPNRA
jgi:hypothetical protein